MKKTIGLTLFSVVTSIVGSQLLLVIPDEIKATNVWMMCDAVAKVLLVGAFWIEAKGALKNVLFGVLLVTFNNMLDEVLFDPTMIGYNDLFLILIIAIYTTFKIYE